MVVNRGGLLASTGAVALMAARSWRSRAPDGEGDAGGGSGAAAAEAGDDEDFFGGSGGSGGDDEAATAAAAAAAAAAAGGGTDDKGGVDDKGGAIEVPEWAKSFSAEKKDGELSNQEWVAKLAVKDLDGIVQLARDNQKALRESGRVKVPGEGASDAEVKAFREAIGAPLEAGAYAVELPAEAKGLELDTAFIDPMKAIAHKYHIPAAAFKEMGDAFMAAQLASVQGDVATNNAERDATLKEWGPLAEQGKEEFRRGMDALGLKTADMRKIQTGYGAKATLELFRKIGQMTGEDFFAGDKGRASERFGVTDAASADAQLKAMENDKDTRAKLRAKDPVTVARFNRLTDAKAHFRQLEQQR